MSNELGRLEDLPPDYVQDLRDLNLVPLWPSLRGVLPPAIPARQTRPTHWPYKSIKPLLLKAGELTPIEKAERRVLVLANPGHGLDKMQASAAMYLGMQLLMPGEWAPSHRHTPNAVRMIVEGEGAYTTVDGEKCPMSREICVHLYNEIIRLRPDWHSDDPEQGAIKIVMTGSASDKALLRPHIYSSQVKKRLEKRFKDPKDSLKLVIVRDMWLTGFDAPCVHTLYVDKPMKGHNLMQAIARVNRVFKDKQGGLVVDYIGIGEDLKAAMKEYTASKGRGKPTVDAREALAVLLEKMDVLRAMLHGFDYADFLKGGHKTLAGAANHVLGLKSDKERDGKKRFADNALAMSHAFSLCCTLPEAKENRDEVAFMQAVKVILTKRETSAQRKTDEERDLAIRQIISSAVVSGEVVDIFAAVGLDKPNIGLLDDDFLAQVNNLPEKNLAVELLERLLQGEIKSRFASNVVQDRKFSDLLSVGCCRYLRHQPKRITLPRTLQD